jgi:uncharacterized phage protein (TIGR01671 family)
MARIIKFRAWGRDTKTMNPTTFTLEQLMDAGCAWFQTRGKGGNFTKNLHYNWMQFTGLKDKNGKEIYEGDILKSAYNGNHAVIWNGECGAWDIDHANDCCRPWKGQLSGHHHMEEVIGNVFENPKLLSK